MSFYGIFVIGTTESCQNDNIRSVQSVGENTLKKTFPFQWYSMGYFPYISVHFVSDVLPSSDKPSLREAMIQFTDVCIYSRGTALKPTLKRKDNHFQWNFFTGCTDNCQNNNFVCNQWWQFHQDDSISVSAYESLLPIFFWVIYWHSDNDLSQSQWHNPDEHGLMGP